MQLPSAATRLIALFGNPVAHSLSPAFQNAAFRHAGVDGVYIALRCEADELSGLLRGIALAGGGGNITLPHKELAARIIDEGTEAVQLTGACNTFWLEESVVRGDNTDVAGAAAAMRDLLGASPSGARVLLIGAGGAARGALASLVGERADEVVVVNRTQERARAMLAGRWPSTTRLSTMPLSEGLAAERFDLAINATSLGLHDSDPLPLSLDWLPSLSAALDLVYTPTGTRWMSALRARGIPALDGLDMLIHQGAASFERWWNRPAPLDVMRAALPSRARATP